jgi:hypothetical protein
VTPAQRDRAVDEFIELVAAVDGILQAQAKADAGYFVATCGRRWPRTRRAIRRRHSSRRTAGSTSTRAPHQRFGKVLSA